MSHWTSDSKNFAASLVLDFVRQIQTHSPSLTNRDRADALGVTAGRISQILNDQANMKVETMVRLARSIGKKVAIVVYDDSDNANESGPIVADIFTQCWNRCGRPRELSGKLCRYKSAGH